MPSTVRPMAEVSLELEGIVMPPRRGDAVIAAAVAGDPDAAPVLPAAELARLFAAERARDPFGVARLRRRLGLSQAGFARRFGVPLATLRQWEQGARRPTEPARVLLQLIADAPAMVEEAAAKLLAV